MQRPKALRRPELVEGWGDILKRAHSNWAQYLTLASLLVPEFVYGVLGRDTDPRLWWWIAIALVIYGICGRMFKQRDTTHFGAFKWIAIFGAIIVFAASCTTEEDPPPPPPSKAVLELEADLAPDPFLELAVKFIGDWEGMRLDAYLDIVGVPTVCFGETRGVKMGDSYTEGECIAMLRREIAHFQKGLHQSFTPETLLDRLPYRRDVAYTSLAYNVGIGGAGKSTAVRRLNGGDVFGACEAITWWNKAGGRVIRGLQRRRSAEFDLCMHGVSAA